MLEAKYCKYLVLKVPLSARSIWSTCKCSALTNILLHILFPHWKFSKPCKGLEPLSFFFPRVDKFRLYESQPSGLCKRNHYRDKRNCFHLFACSIKISFRSVSYSGFISCNQVYREAGVFNRRWRILILIQNIRSLPAKELICSSHCANTLTLLGCAKIRCCRLRINTLSMWYDVFLTLLMLSVGVVWVGRFISGNLRIASCVCFFVSPCCHSLADD